MSILEPKRLLDSDERSPLTSALQKARADFGQGEELAAVRAKLVLSTAGTLSTTGVAPTANVATAASKAIKAWWLAGILCVGGAVFLALPSQAPHSQSPHVGSRAPKGVPLIDVPPAIDPAGATPALPITKRAEQVEGAPSKPRAQARKPLPNAAIATKPAMALHATEEIALLQRAQKLVDTRPGEALSILDEHARAYPSGVFVQERESLAIDALRKLGRAEAAQKRARSFIARYPSSPHARRFSSWLDPSAAIDDEPITKPARSTY